MNKTCIGIFCATMIGLSSAAFAEDCTRPPAPTVPDGSKATLNEMLDAKKAVMQYMSQTNDFMACVDKEQAAVPKDQLAKDKNLRLSFVTRHNAAVDAEQSVANQFNVAIQAFKAKGQAAQPSNGSTPASTSATPAKTDQK